MPYVSNEPPVQLHPDLKYSDLVAFINENFRKITEITDSTAWVPTFTGFSANPTGGLYYYTVSGKNVTLYIRQPNNGTSNATGFTISLPIQAKTLTNMIWVGPAGIIDNGTAGTSPGMLYITSGSTTLTVYKDFAGNVFTNTGNKRIAYGSITYEIE